MPVANAIQRSGARSLQCHAMAIRATCVSFICAGPLVGAEISKPQQQRDSARCGALMGGASLPRKVVTAFRSAGATEEMIASARLIFGSLPSEPPGRPRMYKNSKEADHAFYIRNRDRLREKRAISPNNGATHPLAASNAPVSLQQRLEEACQA
jgi:hypothetical protein